jgi:uncharacterized LabA/DUF88 family protein
VDQPRVGVFIDAENVRGVKLKPLFDVLFSERTGGRLGKEPAFIKAYAGWQDVRLSGLRRQLNALDAETITVEASKDRIRNASDIHLAVDALTNAYSDPNLDTFVVLSGDGGFIPLYRALRGLGRRVVGVANEKSASEKALPVCDAFFVYTRGHDAVQKIQHDGQQAADLDEWSTAVHKVTRSELARAQGVHLYVVLHALKRELGVSHLTTKSPSKSLSGAIAHAFTDSPWCLYRDPATPETWLIDESIRVGPEFERKQAPNTNRLVAFRGAADVVDDEPTGEVSRIVLPADAFIDDAPACS